MEQNKLPIPTQQGIKNDFQLALANMETSFQMMQNKSDALVLNEDNLESITEFIQDVKEVEKKLETFIKNGKLPYLEGGRQWDAAAKDLKGLITAALKRPSEYRLKVITEIDKRKKQAEAEKEKLQAILAGINKNYQEFASRIGNAINPTDLTAIEKLINLEKGRKEKYGEYYEQALEKFNLLTELLKQKKESLKELNKLAEEERNTDDYEEQFNIRKQQSELHQEIKATNVNVLTESIQGISSSHAEVILPDVPKARYTKWMWDGENANFKELLKKHPEWIEQILNKDLIDVFLKQNKEKLGKDKEEFTECGIRFYLHKIY